MNNKDKKHLSSKETMKVLKVSSCELMHLREYHNLKFIKKGNSYLYESNDLERLKNKN